MLTLMRSRSFHPPTLKQTNALRLSETLKPTMACLYNRGEEDRRRYFKIECSWKKTYLRKCRFQSGGFLPVSFRRWHPVYHRKDRRIEAHIFVCFLSYCLQVTLKYRAKTKAPGLTPRAILEKFKAMQMIDVHLPTTDNRNLILPRYTQPEQDIQLLLQQLNLTLPDQPPPRIEELQKKCGADL